MKNRHRQTAGAAGFSLAELLVVIAIMGLILAIALPSFTGMRRAAGLQNAVFQFNTTLSLARQTAITSRQQVVVLLPDEEPTLYAGEHSRHVEKAYRAYAVYGMNDGYLSEWRMLPQGVVFDPDVADRGDDMPRNVFNIRRSYPDGNFTFLAEDVRFPDNEGVRADMFALGFRSDGCIHVGGVIHPTIYLAEGWTEYDPDSGDFEELIIHREDFLLMGITINALTGQANTREFRR